jgi:hypothetical protein
LSNLTNVSEQAEIGREIAAGVGNSIREMGQEAMPATTMQINDIVPTGISRANIR